MFFLPRISQNLSWAIQRSLLWLLLLAIVIRGLVPAGYMPDAAAAQNGQLALTFCTADGAVSTLRFAPESGHDDSSSASGDMDCVFGVLSLQATMTPPEGIEQPRPVLRQSPLLIRTDQVHVPSFVTQGPPLGPRAPPVVS
ncbi:DUF2946 family protein [Paenalcaligenes sp. Me131]|uniref:DUF2946 family protein n=1 Tax=Paenalcaligenes sp. Me131 TaxID=3392636 RepID=UPI003D28CF69